MEIFISPDRIYRIADQLLPFARNLVSPDIEARLISAAAHLVFENPALTDEELMTLAPEYIRMSQNHTNIRTNRLVNQMDIDMYFALKSKPRNMREYRQEDDIFADES